MPEEVKPADAPKPEEKQNTVMVDADKLAAGIAKGVSDSMAALQQRRDESQAVSPPNPLPPIEDVRDEDILDAVEAGDKPKAAGLMRRQRAAERERLQRESLAPMMSAGAAAIASVSKVSAGNLPYYKRFQPEIDGEINTFRTNNPDAVVTPEHYAMAHAMVVGRHTDQIVAETREETLRKQREVDNPLTPEATARSAGPAPKEASTLAEEFGPDFVETFQVKRRVVGHRSEDDEVAHAGYKGGTAQFLKEHRERQKYIEEHPSLGLDE